MNKSKIIFSSICIVILLSFIALMISAFNGIDITTTASSSKIIPQIVIDAGHGGEDGGAVNNEGVLEKNINMNIANDTADLLSFFGFSVTQTRNTDVSLATDGNTVRERKVADMKKRLEMFNSNENNIVISIHQNKFTQSQYYGTQIFYSPNNENSLALAENIKSTVTTLLQPDNKRECKKADKNIYLLVHSDVPAVIVECGFISNPDECAKLVTNEYQKQMAYSIVSGFLNFYNTNS